MDGSVSILAVKLLGTPLVIGGATLVGRRWGPTVSGWIGGLPLASGPLTYFLTVEQGANFGAASAAATLAGLVAVAAFAVAFGRLAGAGSWPLPLSVGLLAYVALAAALVFAPTPPLAAFPAAVVALTAATWLVGMPDATVAPTMVPAWDLPARALVATAIVISLSAAAAALGPRLVGLVAPFPVYASVMASFAHAHDGPAASVRLLRGLLVGAYGFACFYLVVASLVTGAVVGAFLIAGLTALVVQGMSMWAIRRLDW